MLDPRKVVCYLALLMIGFLCHPPKTLGSVGGSFASLKCGSSSALYTNATDASVNFELVVSNNSPVGGCSDTLSWTDLSGSSQSVTVPPGGGFISLSSSIGPSGAVAWSSSGSSSQYVSLAWQLERAPAQSVSGQFGDGAYKCGASGTLYSNLTSGTVNLDLAASTSTGGCSLTLTWTDANNEPQTLSLGRYGSKGVSTSLPVGGVISWKSTSGNVDLFGSWQIERVDISQLW